MTLKPMACVLETQEWVQSREKEILLQTFFAFGHVREQPRFFYTNDFRALLQKTQKSATITASFQDIATKILWPLD